MINWLAFYSPNYCCLKLAVMVHIWSTDVCDDSTPGTTSSWVFNWSLRGTYEPYPQA